MTTPKTLAGRLGDLRDAGTIEKLTIREEIYAWMRTTQPSTVERQIKQLSDIRLINLLLGVGVPGSMTDLIYEVRGKAR